MMLNNYSTFLYYLHSLVAINNTYTQIILNKYITIILTQVVVSPIIIQNLNFKFNLYVKKQKRQISLRDILY